MEINMKRPPRRRRTKVGKWLAVAASAVPIIVELIKGIMNKNK